MSQKGIFVYMKKQRHDKIISIIENYEITTQEMLKSYLEAEHIEVTQATLSRDINELRLKKEMSQSGAFIYVKPIKNILECPQIFKDSIIDILFAMNTVVIKCHTGMAQATCAILDKMNYTDIVGTISGDDTIFALMKSENDACNFLNELKELVFENELE